MSRFVQLVVFCTVLFSVSLSSSVAAKDLDPDTLATLKSRFLQADKDGDGKLTREECSAGMPKIYRGFDKIDVDAPGVHHA